MKTNAFLKQIISLSILMVIAFVLSMPAMISPALAADKTKVAVLFPGVVSDQSWNQFGYEGLMRAKNEDGDETAYSENVSQDMQIEAFRNYAAEGYDVIIGMGGEYTDAARTVAGEYPDINFCVSNGLVGNGENLSSFKVSYSQQGYLAGVLAGLMTKTNKIAAVMAEPIPIVDQGKASFKAGAESVNKDVEVSFVITGSWADVAKAREAGLALINQGVDVLWHILDTADAGLISAAEDKGIYAIGLYRDSAALGPKAVIGSAMGNPSTLVYEAANGHVLNGKANIMDVNTPQGIDMKMTELVPQKTQEKVRDIVSKMRSGEIEVLR